MRIFWLVGESSGDRHAARLIERLNERAPGWEHLGMGGERMREAGCDLVADLREASVMGLFEVVKHLPRLLKLRRRLVEAIRERGVDLVVFVDFPDFNLAVADAVRRAMGDNRPPMLYYVSPQVWAWRRGRAKSIAKKVDAMAVLFPFERQVYEEHGLETVFFGHPLAGEVAPSAPVEELRRRFGLEEGDEAVAILPGSREQEVRRHLGVQLAAVRMLRGELNRPVTALVARANTVPRELLEQLSDGTEDVRIVEDAYDALAVARAGLVKSGTSTVEAAVLGTPFAVLYKVSGMTYRLARLLVRGVQYIAMVNVLAGREVVPERIQDEANPRQLATDLRRLWEGELREKVTRELREVADSLGQPGATERLADWIVERFGGKQGR